MGVGLLAVDTLGIVNAGGDPCPTQIVAESIPVGGAHHVQVVHVFDTIGDSG
jgi:hypothetical protein